MIVGVIGLGSLGNAIVRGLLKSGFPAGDLRVFDIDEAKSKVFWKLNVLVSGSATSLYFSSDIIILAVKPKDFSNVASKVSYVDDGKALVSVVGGVTLKTIVSKIQGKNIFRAMPNIACEFDEAVIAISGLEEIDKEMKDKILSLFSRLGDAIEVDENLMDAFTSLSASGIAFAAEIIRAFYEAGILLGLEHNLAKKVAVKVFTGSTRILSEKGFDEIFEHVATPGGTTIEGIYELNRHGVRGSIVDALKAASNKASKLSS